MTAFPRGSEWRRWDLHVHSPLSILNNKFPRLPDGNPDWDEYIKTLASKPVAVYGITDYFTIDGYKELTARQAKGVLSGITLLPNVEFRLDKVISAKDGSNSRRLNLHVIFAEEVSTDDIEDHFLHDLNFVYQEDPLHKMSLKASNLIALGSKLIKDHKKFEGTPPLQVGAMHAIVSFEDIKKRLRDEVRFANKHLLVLAAEGWDDISWDGQDHLVRKLLLQACDCVFASNPKTVSWCLGRPPYMEGEDSFREEFGNLKPCLHGSDAHALWEVAQPCVKRSVSGHVCETATDCDLRNCWIKADPTFEGLRQVLFEPHDRVQIQSADPTPSKTQYCIDTLDIEDTSASDELRLCGTHLPLNSGLVAVTGGRGSGKTALVDLLAHCFVDRANTNDKNSFVRRVRDLGADFTTRIGFLNGEGFAKSLLDGKLVEQSNVVYIAQGELEQYIGEGSDLNEYIHSLVFSSDAIRNSSLAYDHEALAGRVIEAQEGLAALNKDIADLEKRTAPGVISEVAKQGKQAKAEVEDLKKRVEAAATKLTPEKVAAAQARQKVLDALTAKRAQLTAAKTAVVNAIRFVGNEFTGFQNLIRAVNAAILPLGLGPALELPAFQATTQLTTLNDTLDAEIKAVITDIEKAEKELKTLAADQKEHATLLRKRQEAETRLATFTKQWNDLKALKATLISKQSDRSVALRGMFQLVLDQRTKYDEIIEAFALAKDAVLADLDFDAEISVDRDTLLKGAEVLLDNRSAPVFSSDRTTSIFDDLFGKLESLPSTGDTGLDAVIAETDRLAGDLKEKLKKTQSLSSYNLYDLLYRSYFSVHPIVRYQKVSLDRLSMGQKSTVLLKIYLAEGDSPIIIDPHDDHLDNESIMAELVDSIRQAKTFRQVILASNNGNVVVNSDAEQLIIARCKDGEITYMSGSLEDPQIRSRALAVLEGGERAFQRRQEKYRLGR